MALADAFGTQHLGRSRRSPAWRALPGQGVGPARIGDMLDRTLRSIGAPTTVAGVEVVFERWDEVVGSTMAARTRPVRIEGDALVVGCDEPAVATHVRFLQSQLVERLAELSGDHRIVRIEVRVDGPKRRGPRPPRSFPRPAQGRR